MNGHCISVQGCVHIFFHKLQLLGTVNSRENFFSFPLKHCGDDLENSLKDECGKNIKPGVGKKAAKHGLLNMTWLSHKSTL